MYSTIYSNGELDLNQVAERILQRMNNTKKISKAAVDLTDVKYVLNLIDCINQLPEHAVSYDGFRLEDIHIPQCFKDFVWPSRVAFKAEAKYPDLRKVHQVQCEEKVDLSRLKDIADKIGSQFKVSVVKKSIAELRGAKTLDDVQYSVIVEGEMRVDASNSEKFVPIPVCDAVATIVGNHVVNEDASYVVGLFLDYLEFDK